jgi:hypothetical protein
MTFDNFKAALDAIDDDDKVQQVDTWVRDNISGDEAETNHQQTVQLLLVARDALQTWFNNLKAYEKVDVRLQLALNAIDRAFWVSDLEDIAHGLTDWNGK